MPLTPEQIGAVVRLLKEKKQREAEAEANKPGLLKRAAPTLLRVGGGVGGALAGGALGGPVGLMAGGGAGAAAGEAAAQALEADMGLREGISPTGIAIEGALGAIPLGKTATLARAAKQGALLAGGSHVAHKVIEEGQMPGLETVPVTALGALFGAGAHGVASAAGKALSRRVPQAIAGEVDETAARYADLGGEPRPHTLADVFTPKPAPETPLRQGLPDLAEEAAPAAAAPGVPFMVTRAMRQRLADLGFDPQDIDNMKPEEAWAALRSAEGAAGATVAAEEPMRQGFPEALAPESALAPRTGYTLTEPLDLKPPVHYTGRTPALLPESASPIPLPESRISSPEPVATDVVGSPRPGLTGLFESQDARLRAKAPSSPVEAPEPPATGRSTEPEISQPAPSPAAGASEIPSPLLDFLRGRGQGATMAQLKKKFGPGIEAVIEKLAQRGKLSWGGKAGNEKFSLSDASGFMGNELQQMVGGGIVGGALGATQGETPEERLTYGLLGAGAGAAGGAQLGKLLERRRLGPNPSKVAEAILGPTSATEAAGPVIPAATKVATDKRIPVIGGQKLSSMQGDVPVGQIAEPPAATMPPRGQQPKHRYEQAGFNPNNYHPELREFYRTHVIDDALKAEVEQQRRGRLSIAWANERAKQYMARLDKPLAPGTVIKPEEALALGKMEAGLAAQAAEQLAAGDKIGGLKSMMQQRSLYLGRVGAVAEAARTMRYVQTLNAGMSTSERLVREAMKQGRLTKVLGEFDDLIANLPKDPTEAAKFLAAHMESGAFDKITSYFMANILSAIPSFVRNGIGSAVNSVGRLAVKGALAGPIDALLAKLTGRQRAIYSTEVLHEIAGGSFAVREGLNDAWSTYRNGFSTRGIKEGAEFGELNLPKMEFQGGLMNPWNQPGRILESTDRFFQTFNQNMSKNGLAWAAAQREADKRGLVGQAFDDFMSQRMAQLMEDDFIRGAAVEEGRKIAFREDPGKIANTLIGLKQQAPVLNFIIPFVKTVSNIFRQGIEHSPFAPILSRTRAKMMPNTAGMSEAETWMAHREQAEALAKWGFGLASTMPIAAYAATGQLSGSGPSDPAKRAALYEQGWRPNSIQIGGKWYNYSTWQPLSIPMALIANAFESYEDSVDSFTREGQKTDWEKVAASTAFKVLNSATQQSYLQGVMALSAAMEDPDQFAENFLRQMAQGFYPLSGLQRTVTRGFDPTIRENKTVQESLQRITPGASEALPSRLNRWGEDVKYSGGPLWRMVGGPVFGGEGDPGDPINRELQRLGVDVGLPSERMVMGGQRVNLGRAQGHEMRQMKGQLVRDALERVILSAGYNELPDALKRERVEDALAKVSRANARQIRIGLQSNPSDFLSLLRERAANRGN